MECTKLERAFWQALERRSALDRPRPPCARPGLAEPPARNQPPRAGAGEGAKAGATAVAF